MSEGYALADADALRSITVKTLLTAEEFIVFAQLAESKGLSQSAYVRMLIKADIAREQREVPEQARKGPA